MNKHIFWITPAALVCSVSQVAATQYLTVAQAQRVCFAQATRFVASPVVLTNDQTTAIEKDSGIKVRNSDQKVWTAYSESKFLGWFMVDDVIGKHDYITWALALLPDGSVKQIEILEYRENYGSEVRNEKWRSQFAGKKRGAAFKIDQDIKNISGSTLSSRHIADGVKRLLSFYEIVLKKG
jgi:Na+-transporting NADH:ubiquinone oxidoreductase subunit NqrC